MYYRNTIGGSISNAPLWFLLGKRENNSEVPRYYREVTEAPRKRRRWLHCLQPQEVPSRWDESRASSRIRRRGTVPRYRRHRCIYQWSHPRCTARRPRRGPRSRFSHASLSPFRCFRFSFTHNLRGEDDTDIQDDYDGHSSRYSTFASIVGIGNDLTE